MAFLDETGVTSLTSDIKTLADATYIQQDVIADQYDSTTTYAVGDYCIKDGVLYKCTTAISTAEAWTSGHWESTAVTDEFGGSGGLPSVTTADNGKVMSVVEGEWAAAELLSASGVSF